MSTFNAEVAEAMTFNIIKQTIGHLVKHGVLKPNQRGECLTLFTSMMPKKPRGRSALSQEERAAKKQAAAEKTAEVEARKAARLAKKQAAAEAKAEKALAREAKKQAAAQKKQEAAKAKAAREQLKIEKAEAKAVKLAEKEAKRQAAEEAKAARALAKLQKEAEKARKAANPRPKGRAPKGKTWCYETGEWLDDSTAEIDRTA